MASLFAPRSNPIQSTGATRATRDPMQPQQIQNDFTNPQIDREAIVENAIQQSGGDAKAAFYLAAKQLGIDGDQALAQIQSMGDIRTMAQKAMASNPKIRRLASLFSLMK